MTSKLQAIILFALLSSPLAVLADPPAIISYQGKVSVGGANFNGTGQFKFALVDGTGATTFWSNDGTSTAGSQPTAAVSLNVLNGLYSLGLGDSSLTNMQGIPASVFMNPDVRERVWFNDGTHGFQLLTPDKRVTSVGYAMVAGGLRLPVTTGANFGVITQSGGPLIHTFGTNNFFAGTGTGNFTTTGTGNTGIGYLVLSSNTTGSFNVANGYQALQSNTTGNNNTAIGLHALLSNTMGTDNTATGDDALRSNTSGDLNTATGGGALFTNTTGNRNTATGYDSLFYNTTGFNNTGSGVSALQENTTGYDNTANGAFALYFNTTGERNTATGVSALYSNTEGFYNTATGVSALHNNTVGNRNTATGDGALSFNSIGSSNSAFGSSALLTNVTGNSNTAVGDGALNLSSVGDGNTGVGYYALLNKTTGSNNTALGYRAGINLTAGSNNIAIGHSGVAGESNIIRIGTPGTQTDTFLTGVIHGDGSGLTNLPASPSITNITLSGQVNLSSTLSMATGVIAQNGVSLIHSYGTNNFFAGSGAGNFLTSGGGTNTGVGGGALAAMTTGVENTAVGWSALLSMTTGANNTAVGQEAMRQTTVGSANTAFGENSLVANIDGSSNTALGQGALGANTTGSHNIAIGVGSGRLLTTGNNNIEIGHPGVAGESNTIRLGTPGTQTAAFVAGISGVTSSGGAQVFINSSGQLGTLTSSARFKDHIQPMGEASECLFALRPVTFRYKPELDPKAIPQWGLIAEEVNEVNSDLVVRDDKGEILTVRYEQVNAMLLNEFQKDHRRADQRDAEIKELRKDNADLNARVERLEQLLLGSTPPTSAGNSRPGLLPQANTSAQP